MRWFIFYNYNVHIVDYGNRAKIKRAIGKSASKGHEPRYVFMDIPRALGNQCNLKALEQVKDATFAWSKWRPGWVSLHASPIITVLANAAPDLTSTDPDRLNVICVDEQLSVNQGS